MNEIIKALIKKQKILIGFYFLMVASSIVIMFVGNPEKSGWVAIMFTGFGSFFIWIAICSILPVIFNSTHKTIIPKYTGRIKQAIFAIAYLLYIPLLMLLPDYKLLLIGISALALFSIVTILCSYKPMLWLPIGIAYFYVVQMDKMAFSILREYLLYFGYGFPLLLLIQYFLIQHVNKFKLSEARLKRLKNMVNMTNTKQMFSADGQRISYSSWHEKLLNLNSYSVKKLFKRKNKLSSSEIIKVATFGPNNVGMGTFASYFIVFGILTLLFLFFQFKIEKPLSIKAIDSFLGIFSMMLVGSSFTISYIFFSSIKTKFQKLWVTPLFNDKKSLRLYFVHSFIKHNLKNAALTLVLLMLLMSVLVGFDQSRIIAYLLLIASSFFVALGASILLLHSNKAMSLLYNIMLLVVFLGTLILSRLISQKDFTEIALYSLLSIGLIGIVLCLIGYRRWISKEPNWHSGAMNQS